MKRLQYDNSMFSFLPLVPLHLPGQLRPVNEAVVQLLPRSLLDPLLRGPLCLQDGGTLEVVIVVVF